MRSKRAANAGLKMVLISVLMILILRDSGRRDVAEKFYPLDGGCIEGLGTNREVKRAVGFDAELSKLFPHRLDNTPATFAGLGIELQVQGRVPVSDRGFFRGA